ncbi:MAG: LysE family transporter [Rikenellaceae bacterium]
MTFEIIDLFVRAVVVGVAASITVGPVAILCIQRTLSKNRRAGIISGLGVAAADTLLAFISYICYSLIQNQIEQYSSVLHIVGGLFVVAVGAYIFMQNPMTQLRRNRSARSSSWQDFVSIFGLTLTNFIMVIPYILAFFAVFKIPSYDSSSIEGLISAAVVVGGFFSGSATWWSGLACVINLFRRRFRPRHLIIINRVAGSLIALLGCSTILTTFFHLLPNELFK